MARGFRPRTDDGFTLVELIATLAILMVVVAVVYAGLQTMQKSVIRVEAKQDHLNEGRNTINNLSKAVRTATSLESTTSPFLQAEDYAIEFYAYLNSTEPRLVEFSVDADGRMIRETTEPDSGSGPNYTYTIATPFQTILGTGVQNVTDSIPIFTYFDTTGAAMAAPVTGSDRGDIQSIGIELQMNEESAFETGPTVLQTRILIRNFVPPTPTP